MIGGILSTPRPVPGRRVPTLAGGAAVLLALPVFLVAGFPLGGWGLAAVLWAAGELLTGFLARLPLGVDNLGSSAVVGLATTFRSIGIMIALLGVTAVDRRVGIAAVCVYVFAYTLELGVSLVEYFLGERR